MQLVSKPGHVLSITHSVAHATRERTWNVILSALSRDGIVQLGLKITQFRI